MTIGRIAETAQLTRLVHDARGRVSSAVIVHGEPGIGKTSLLEQVLADANGFLLLRTRPLEAESELPFAGLFDLVRPILHRLDEIPSRQAAALSGAFALGPPAAADRFAVGAATLSLLAAAADESPTVVFVDDAHWLDMSSRDALLFAGRRLGNEGVVLTFAMRDRDWLRASGVATLELGGLADDDAGALVDGAYADIDADVRSQLVDGTRGNPLAILQAIEMLSEEELRGAVPIRHPLAIGGEIEDAFAAQLLDLPDRTQRALLVAAASDTGRVGEIVQALGQVELDRLDLEAAERVRMVVLTGDRLEFRHPLVRSAAYQQFDPVEQRAAHRALAAASDSPERSAWHLAAATTGPDETVAALLEAAGGEAFIRSAYASAAAAFETAATLSLADPDRLRRTMRAGQALWLAGKSDRAEPLLESVVELAHEPSTRADLQLLRGATLVFTRPPVEAYEILVAEGARVEPHDPIRAAMLYASAVAAYLPDAELERAIECAERALRVAEPFGEAAEIFPALTCSLAYAIRGRIGESRALVDSRIDALTAAAHPANGMFWGVIAAAQTFTMTGAWESAGTLLDRLVGTARAVGAPAALAFPLAMASEFELRQGRVAAAYAAAAESVQLAQDTGQHNEAGFSLVTLARAEAVLGRDEDSREHVAAARDIAVTFGVRSISIYSSAVAGLLELSRGRAAEAATELRFCDARDRELGVQLPTVTQWSADLVEAELRAGSRTNAERALAVFTEKAELTGVRWATAGVARCRGLLTQNGFEEEFARSIEEFGEEMPLERARTQLCLGARLRRDRRRRAAREVLDEALAFFEDAGAEPWAEQVRVELRAMGAPTSAAPGESLRTLTAQELQVALTVAKGATNREAAAALFLSVKTVEFHLTNAYRKLGLRSRSELVRRLAQTVPASLV